MAAPSTFIKLDRNITKWRWYTNANTVRVWLHLLMSANIAPYEFENIRIERGQLVTSHENLANTLKLSIQEVRTALNHLKSTGEITTTAHRRFQVISIVNYNLYQGELTGTVTSYQQADNILSTSYQQQYKNIKNNKNDKEIYMSVSKESKTPKHKYGEYNNVLLTDEEYDKLKSEYSDYESRIENLSSYIASTGKKYKSHYATIKNWAKKETPTLSSNKKELTKFGGTYL